MKNFFLIFSGIVTLVAIFPYVRDIIKGSTKPNIVSWITWTLLIGIATIAEIADHEYRTAIFTSTVFVEVLAIVILGLFYGYVKYTRFDYICQLSTLLGLALWWLFDSPSLAVVAAVTIDFIGALPTFRHAWNQPGEETWSTYALSGLGGGLAIFALTSFNWTSLPYPLYIFFVNNLMAAIIIYRSITNPNFKPSKTSKIRI